MDIFSIQYHIYITDSKVETITIDDTQAIFPIDTWKNRFVDLINVKLINISNCFKTTAKTRTSKSPDTKYLDTKYPPSIGIHLHNVYKSY